MTKSIFISGSGGIGEAAALLLREWSEDEITIFLGDVNASNLQKAHHLILSGSKRTWPLHIVLMTPIGVNEAMKAAFEQCDCLLDCSPGQQAPRMAGFAREFGMHYANLTEYVAETDQIIELAQGAETGFILQTGLAPGFINVLAMSLFRRFCERFNVNRAERITMKVGALTQHAQAPHFYGFTWSPVGVATEYVKNARVIRNGNIAAAEALSDREKILIDGRLYEADLTSGGAADLPEYFKDKVNSLDYKTLRHVGHYDYVEKVVRENQGDAGLILNQFLREIPAVDDDFVLVHSSVEGVDDHGTRRMIEKAFMIEPLEINGHRLRAIQTSTAVPLLEAAMMLRSGKHKGAVLQSQIDPDEFLNGRFISRIYKS